MLAKEQSARIRVAIVGPTAVGKTAVSVAVASLLGCEIVSADSMQVYRHMDVGTAKPTLEERAQAIFHMVDVVDPDEEWTLADYQQQGNAACADCEARGKVPLIVGGTGLYVRSVTTELDIPAAPPDEELRESLRQEAEETGTPSLHSRLKEIDPEAADRIHINDLKRIIRAIEVFQTLGITLSELHARNRAMTSSMPVTLIGLQYQDRRKLYDRIEKRVDVMMADGLVDEVKSLLGCGYHAGLKPMQSLGYKQICLYLSGNMRLGEAVEDIKRETRHYARRQLIWFRADKRVRWVCVDDRSVDETACDIVQILGTDCSENGRSYAHE